MQQVLLVFPIPSDEQTGVTPPLSILYVGAFLEKAGISVSYIDLRIHSLNDLKAELEREPSIVGISSMTGYQLKGTIDVLERVRNYSPEIITVLGGVHASLLPHQTISDPRVDFVVVGEGEETMVELYEALDTNKSEFSNILGLGWKKDEVQSVINENRPFIDLSKSVPPITSSSVGLYDYYPLGKVQMSRGCPHRCAFCYNSSFNRRKYRVKPLDTIESEIQVIKRFVPRLKHFTLLSDNIGRKKENLMDIAKLCSKHEFTFHTAIRPEFITEDLLAGLEGTCESLFFGIETLVPRLRKIITKDNTVDDVKRTVQMLSHSSIKAYYSYMTGFPTETKEETIATMDFIDYSKKIDPKCIVTPLFLLTAYPGTELYSYSLKNGFKEPATLSQWCGFGLGQVTSPWIDKEDEYFTDLYGISLLIYTDPKEYRGTPFEMELFTYLQEKANKLWLERRFEFKKELRIFNVYNKQFKQLQLKDYSSELSIASVD